MKNLNDLPEEAVFICIKSVNDNKINDSKYMVYLVQKLHFEPTSKHKKQIKCN